MEVRSCLGTGKYLSLPSMVGCSKRATFPEANRVHDVFHISLLKPHKGSQPDVAGALPLVFDGKAMPTPQAVLRSRINRGTKELLIQWADHSPEEATWEPFVQFQIFYPEFELEDKLKDETGSDDMDTFVGKKYQRMKLGYILCSD